MKGDCDMEPTLAIAIVAYMFPTIVACTHKCPQRGWVVFLNIFLGWTIIGWWSALILSFTDESGDEEPTNGKKLSLWQHLTLPKNKFRKEHRNLKRTVVISSDKAKEWFGRKRTLKLKEHLIYNIHFNGTGDSIGLTDVDGETLVVSPILFNWGAIMTYDEYVNEFGRFP